MAMPTKRTPELVDAILARLAKGEPLAVICRSEGMPDRRTVNRWRSEDEDLDARFQEARDDGFDAIAAAALAIADDGSEDYKPGKDGPTLDSEHVQRSRLRVDTRLKLLAKWDPKRYGDRQILAGDPEAPLQGLSLEQINERLRKHGIDPDSISG